MQTLTLTQPDDWHIHLRDGIALQTTVPHAAKQFGRTLIMPNLKPPVTDISTALAYQQRILAARPAGSKWQPLMSLYLTHQSTEDLVKEVAAQPTIIGFKLYPAGATTNSEAGITHLTSLYPVLEAMQKHDVPLLIHGESTRLEVDVFDKEKYFIEETLIALCQHFPELRIVFEHITTKEAVDFVEETSAKIAATITAHHLLYNRNALFEKGIRPHYYCLPILKRQGHQARLLVAATSANPKFFLGTDSAPHIQNTKESACGCAGIYTAHAAIELYAEAFANQNALEKLESFASHFGADFYGLRRNTNTITLEKIPQTIPASFKIDKDPLIPLRATESISWRLQGSDNE